MSTQTPSLDKSPTEAADEFNAALEDLLSQLDTKFRSVSTDILVKLDEMQRRIDEIEEALLLPQTNAVAEKA